MAFLGSYHLAIASTALRPAPRTAYEIAGRLEHHLAIAQKALASKELEAATTQGESLSWEQVFALLKNPTHVL
jgi:hypothetical protein